MVYFFLSVYVYVVTDFIPQADLSVGFPYTTRPLCDIMTSAVTHNDVTTKWPTKLDVVSNKNWLACCNKSCAWTVTVEAGKRTGKRTDRQTTVL